MKADLKAKWIEALRSGDYEQGKAEFRNTANQYCCLGVLCAVSGVELTPGGTGRWDKIWPLVKEHGMTLALMNDGKGGNRQHTFPEIADWIEKNIPAE